MPPNNSVPSTDVAAGSGSSMLSSANLVEASFNSGKPWPNPDRPPKSGPQVMRETHVKLTELFKLMLSLNTDAETRERIKNELIALVTKHILTEEQVLYPTVKTVAPEAGEDVNKSVEQETFLKQNLIRLETLRATEDSFHWFAKETFNALQRHMKHEEQNLFPVLKKKLGSEELNNMGELYETIFEVAPTRPIPSSTQKPVTEVCAQPLTVYFEKVRNLASKQRMAMLR